MPDISTVADISIKVKDRGLSRQAFGNMALLFETVASPGWRTKIVTSPSDVVALGAVFGEFSPVYIAARDAFAQETAVPQLLLINKLAAESESQALTAADAENSDWYCLIYTSRTAANVKLAATYCESRTKPCIYIAQTADADTLLGGASVIKDLYDLSRARTAVIYHAPAKQKLRLTISAAFVAGNSATIKVNGVAIAAVPFNATSDTTLADLATALAATAAIGTAVVTTIAAATDNDRVIEIEATDNQTNVALTEYTCAGGGTINTATIEVESGGAEDAAAAWASSRVAQDVGSITWKFGELAGITADALNPTQQAFLELYKANHYLTYGSAKLPAQGTMSTGRFIDIQQGIDWIAVNMQADIFDLLQTMAPKKIPYTDKGMQQLSGPVRSRLRLAVAAQILAEDPAPVVTVPLVSAQAPADKALRVVKGITFSGTLAGAAHKVTVSGEVVP